MIEQTKRRTWWDGVRPYAEPAPLAALFLGISSGFPFAMIAATLTTRLAEAGIEKSTVTAFALTFLAYNFKWLWAPIIDAVQAAAARADRTAGFVADIHRVAGDGERWIYLGSIDPQAHIGAVAVAAILAGRVAGLRPSTSSSTPIVSAIASPPWSASDRG